MRRIDVGTLGGPAPEGESGSWPDLLPPGLYRTMVDALMPDSTPTEVQIKAIQEANLLTSRRNLLISSTTNSGKTLLAYFALVRGLGKGKRVLLLEPLRSLAQEKHAELKRLAAIPGFGEMGGFSAVKITTGDYRLDQERMQAPPPEDGEVVVATPERIEAILRNPDFDEWINTISVVVIDEAHLLADPVRGASHEMVMTSLKQLRIPPRMVLLSATLGDATPLLNWLTPCDIVSCPHRSPALHRSILGLESGDDLSTLISETIKEILSDSGNAVLVFVYQTASADKLARDLGLSLGPLAGPAGPRSYHSRQSAATREMVRQEFATGSCRCVVATTALAMGVNLPATHVVLRDLARGAEGPIRPDEMIQMSGRAGRGNREGHALLVLKPKDPWTERELVEALEIKRLPAIQSMLVSSTDRSGFRDTHAAPPLAKGVLSVLGRVNDGSPLKELEAFLRATLAGEGAAAGLTETLQWLSAPSRILAVCEDELWKATALGRTAIRSSVPLEAAAGMGQLVRDLLSIDPEDEILRSLSKLDLLILAELLATGAAVPVRFSEKLADQVDSWMSQSSEKSVLFTRWIRGTEGFSKSDEILGSLGLAQAGLRPKSPGNPRKLAYVATCRAIILWQRGLGVRVEDLESRWGVRDLGEIEEKWRDNRLFLLGAVASLWEVKCFYYHLKEECQADQERVWRVKRAFQRLAAQTYQLLDLVAWTSPLGPIFVRMRRTLAGVKGATPAHATLRRLEEHGITSVDALRKLTEAEYKRMGIRSDLVRVIGAFLRRG